MKKIIIRTAIALGVIILIALGLFIYNISQMHNKMQRGEYSLVAGLDTIPFTMSSSGHILVQVKINGSTKTYPFILDCGAKNFVFSNRINEFKLPKNGFGIGRGASGNFFFTRIRKIESLSIGNASFSLLNAEELEFTSDCPDQTYGLIGIGVMHHLVWQIDFEKKVIIMATSKEKLSFSDDSIVIPLAKNRFSNHLYANIQFGKNKKKHSLIVDTGNSGAITMQEEKVLKDSVKAASVNIFGEGSRGLGKSAKQQNEKIYLMDTLYFRNGSFLVNRIPVQTSESGIDLLGLSFFEHYKITISWTDQALILDPISNNPQFIWDSYGFRLKFDEQSGKTSVCAIIENTSAHKQKVPLNAVVVSAGDIKFTNREALCTFKSMNIKDEYLNLVLIENGAERMFRLKKGPVIE